jgi:predicted RNA binding protein YcfA (HicA-like mRNA interferase family)
MKLPRGVSGERLVRALEQLGYSVIRQKGSHTRMRHEGPRFIRSLSRCTIR